MPTLIRRVDPSFGTAFEDPFRLMRELMRREGAETHSPKLAFLPSADIKETANEYVIHADLPGVAEKDVDISLTGNQLTLSGKREAKQKKDDERYHSFERSFGSFTRSFTLPDSVDAENITAELRDGVLTLHVPKRPEVKARKIELKGLVSQPKSQA